jgi:hypothetical protein
VLVFWTWNHHVLSIYWLSTGGFVPGVCWHHCCWTGPTIAISSPVSTSSALVVLLQRSRRPIVPSQHPLPSSLFSTTVLTRLPRRQRSLISLSAPSLLDRLPRHLLTWSQPSSYVVLPILSALFRLYSPSSSIISSILSVLSDDPPPPRGPNPPPSLLSPLCRRNLRRPRYPSPSSLSLPLPLVVVNDFQPSLSARPVFDGLRPYRPRVRSHLFHRLPPLPSPSYNTVLTQPRYR